MCLCVNAWIHSAWEWNEAKETATEAKWECKTAARPPSRVAFSAQQPRVSIFEERSVRLVPWFCWRLLCNTNAWYEVPVLSSGPCILSTSELPVLVLLRGMGTNHVESEELTPACLFLEWGRVCYVLVISGKSCGASVSSFLFGEV